MNKTINSDSYYFEAAVKCKLLLARNTDANDDIINNELIIEAVVICQYLDNDDVVVDFCTLEKSLEAILQPMQGHLLSNFNIQNICQLLLYLADQLKLVISAPSKLSKISINSHTDEELSLHLI